MLMGRRVREVLFDGSYKGLCTPDAGGVPRCFGVFRWFLWLFFRELVSPVSYWLGVPQHLSGLCP